MSIRKSKAIAKNMMTNTAFVCWATTLVFFIDAKQIIPKFEDFESAKNDLFNLIESSRMGNDLPMIAGTVRLVFHDCIGKGHCDGCLDHSNPGNAGLKIISDKLDLLYDSSYKGKLSRADFYALSAVVALNRSTASAPDKFLGLNNFKVGREDCRTSPVEIQDVDPPKGTDGTTKTFDFFKNQFGFKLKESVALLGAHTLGRCHLQNSGFVGSWVDETFSTVPPDQFDLAPTSVLDNSYYRMFIDIVPWFQVTINGTNKQWQLPSHQIPNDQLSPSEQTTLLLNSDMANSWVIKPVDKFGTVSCAPTSNTIPCRHSDAHVHARSFARSNSLWVAEFSKAFNRMIEMNSKKLKKAPIAPKRRF